MHYIWQALITGFRIILVSYICALLCQIALASTLLLYGTFLSREKERAIVFMTPEKDIHTSGNWNPTSHFLGNKSPKSAKSIPNFSLPADWGITDTRRSRDGSVSVACRESLLYWATMGLRLEFWNLGCVWGLVGAKSCDKIVNNYSLFFNLHWGYVIW